MSGPTLAVLGMKVENGEVVKATASLDKMTVAGTKTEVATQKLTRRMALLEIQAREMDAAMVKSSRAATMLSSAFAGFSAIAVVGLIGRETIKQTIDAQNAMAQLGAAVESTGGVAGRTVQQLDALSMQLQRQTTFSDEAVKGAEAMLLTFDKIRGVEFDRATAAVTDLAARMGGDLQGAAIQVGKALQDPTTGLSALRRSGVSFSESQIAVIKQLYATGQAAEGQRVILAELEHQFGGSAAAARDTLGGALKSLSNAWGDLFEVSRNGSQGTVDAINAITKSLEDNGMTMNQFVLNTVVGWNNISAAVQKAHNWMSVDWSQGISAAIAQVQKLNAAIENERVRLNFDATLPAKIAAAGGGGGGGGGDGESAAEREAQRIADQQANAQNQLAIDEIRRREKQEKDRIRDEEQYAKDISDIWDRGIADVVNSTERGFRAMLESIGGLIGNLIDRMAKEGKSSFGLSMAAAGIGGGMAGFGFGQSLFSTSHGGFGNTARGALGGAGAGALAGGLAGSAIPVIGTALGALVGGLAGFAGGILGVGSASREAAKAMAEAVKQVTLSMTALRATVHGETLEGAIAAVEADRAQRAKTIEEAWSGGDANSDRVRWRTQQHKELNALEDERIRQLREEYALAQARAAEDLQVRLLTAQGRDEEARTLALLLSQERERQALIKSFGESIDPVEQATLSLLDQVQAQEKLKAATDAANGSALNMVDGYKALQSHIFAAMSPRSSLGGQYGPIASPFPVPSSSTSAGDLTVNVMTPNGEVLGKAVIRDFARRKRLGDAELGQVLS
jgi:hypothetical protein